jgi:hypothetical protein
MDQVGFYSSNKVCHVLSSCTICTLSSGCKTWMDLNLFCNQLWDGWHDAMVVSQTKTLSTFATMAWVMVYLFMLLLDSGLNFSLSLSRVGWNYSDMTSCFDT